MLLRQFFSRHRKPYRNFSLVQWCITNPGHTNVYVHKSTAQILPIDSLLSGIKSSVEISSFNTTLQKSINKRLQNTSLKKSAKAKSVESLIFDKDAVRELWSILQSDSVNERDLELIGRHFANLLEIVNGYSSERNVDLLCEIWRTVFQHPSKSIWGDIQRKILEKKDRFLHILMNYGRYLFYEHEVKPLYSSPEYLKLQSWTDTIANTVRFTSIDGNLIVDTNSVSRFLVDKDHTIVQKRKLLSIVLRKCLLYSSKTQHGTSAATFFSLLSAVEEDHMNLVGTEHDVYSSGLRILFTPPKTISIEAHLQMLLHHIKATNVEQEARFLTTAMFTILSIAPKSVLEICKLKESLHLQLSHMDLTICMNGLRELKKYDAVLELYQNHPDLHNDDQIMILLQVSKETHDWKGLQCKFEEMYGKGYLPYEGHYALVMNALASLGSVLEVYQLYGQLKRRQLHPSPSVYAALINVHLFTGNVAKAEQEFEGYLEGVKNGENRAEATAYLLSLIVKVQAKSQNLTDQLLFLEKYVQKEKELGINLIDSEHLCATLNLAATVFSPFCLERVLKIASKSNKITTSFLESTVRAYTHLEQFEKAEEIAYEAHIQSDVPFTNAVIYKAQLRNYRLWYLSDRTRETRNFILDRVDALIARFKNRKIRIEGSKGLMAEIIKFQLLRNKVADARDILIQAEKADMLSENLITPLMNYYSKQKTYDGFSKVLDLYRQMASQKIPIGTKSYVYLMKALIYLDGKNDNGLENSYKLLESLFELNGIKLENPSKSRILVDHAHNSAVDLCRVVSSYVMACNEVSEKTNALLFDFVKFLRTILGENLSNELRFTIYHLLGKLYLHQGLPELSSRLVDSGLDELETKIKQYIDRYQYGADAVIPRALGYIYRQLFGLKLNLLEVDEGVLTDDYLKLYKQASLLQVQVSGVHYNALLDQLTRNHDLRCLDSCLEICEEHLITGNWIEAKIMRKQQYLYKIVICHFIRAIGEDAVTRNFKILNSYYNVLDLKKLQREFSRVKDPLRTMEAELYEVNQLVDRGSDWTVDEILANIPEFFNPERLISSAFKVAPYLLNRLTSLVKHHCGSDKDTAFKLMDKYPETMEYLLFHESNSMRRGIFRSMIDEVIPRPGRSEDFRSRRNRTNEALGHLKALHGSHDI